MTIGEKLFALRKKTGLTAKEAATQAGTSESTLLRMEKGKVQPKSSEMVEAFAKLYGCSVKELTDDSVDINKEATDEKTAPKDKIPASDIPFGQRLGNLRKGKRLTIKQVSEAVGISEGQYKAHEYQNARPRNVPIYDKFAEVLGCDVAYLTDGDERFSSQKDAPAEKKASDKKAKESAGEKVSLVKAKAEKAEQPTPAEKAKADTMENPAPTENPNVDAPFSEKLSTLRVDKGLGQKQMAEMLGMPINTYRKMENKNDRPETMEIYEKIAEILGCEVGYLTPGDEKFSPQKDAPAEQESAPTKKKASDKKVKSADEKHVATEESAVKEEKPAPMVPVSEPISKRLSALRKSKNLTLAQVADKAGISVETYKGMEYRNYRPRDIKAYDKLAKVFGCDVEYLKEGDQRFEKAAPVKNAKQKADVPTEAVSTEKKDKPTPKEPVTSVQEPSSSSEVIRLVSKLSVLLSGDKLTQSEKDAVMASLNGAYWGNQK